MRKGRRWREGGRRRKEEESSSIAEVVQSYLSSDVRLTDRSSGFWGDVLLSGVIYFP